MVKPHWLRRDLYDPNTLDERRERARAMVNDIEKERGDYHLGQAYLVNYKGTHINIFKIPQVTRDFGGEVEAS